MTDNEREEALRIANKVFKKSSKKLSRRITINKDDLDAFDMLWGIYTNAYEATDGSWIEEEDQSKISRLFRKIHGKK